MKISRKCFLALSLILLALVVGCENNSADYRADQMCLYARNGDIEKIRELIDKYHVDPNASSRKYNGNAIYLASAYGHLDVVRFLLDHGADPNKLYGPRPLSPLAIASACGNLGLVKLLIDYGAKMTWEEPSDQIHSTRGVLAVAVACNNYQIIEYLLNHGADPNVGRGWDGGTALMASIFHQKTSIQIIQLLLDHGACVTDVDDSGSTALDIAKGNHRDDVVQLLESYRLKEYH